MEPRIETLPETKLIGKKVSMSLTNNRTKELWQEFMPKRGLISNPVNSDLYSVEVYESTQFFKQFNPNQAFEKWAAIRVSDFNQVPDEMESLLLPGGLYAVFLYRGKASEASEAYQYIYGSWIPNADYELDDRPHFARMDERYKNEDPDSEEELWIPIKKK